MIDIHVPLVHVVCSVRDGWPEDRYNVRLDSFQWRCILMLHAIWRPATLCARLQLKSCLNKLATSMCSRPRNTPIGCRMVAASEPTAFKLIRVSAIVDHYYSN